MSYHLAGIIPRQAPPTRRERPRLNVSLPLGSRKRRRTSGDQSESEEDEEDISRRNLDDYRQTMQRLGPKGKRTGGGVGEDILLGSSDSSRFVYNTGNPDRQRQERFMAAAERHDARAEKEAVTGRRRGRVDDGAEALLPEDRHFLAPEDDDFYDDSEDSDGEISKRRGNSGSRRRSNRRMFDD